jgi:hypothetical protein
MTAKRFKAALICGAGLCGLLAASGVSPAAAAGATCSGHRATIVGTRGDDRIRGTNQMDIIVARGGDDVVRALSGCSYWHSSEQ